MSRTVTAFFDSRSEAEQARSRLTASTVDADNVKIMDKNSTGGSDGEDHGFWASVKSAFMPAEDAHSYDEGLKRGGFLLCARVDEDEADEAIRILDESDSVDFDSRESEWRSQGWTGFTGFTDTGVPSGAGMGASGQGVVASDSFGSSGFGGSDTRSSRENIVEEEHVPIVEEQLRVGKREVERGGARVRSYVREVPVHEQVNLREEHVSVERRPVGERSAVAGLSGNNEDTFRDRTIEMTERSEEAVVAKEAQVREELVVKKTAEERTEQIDDNVRRTEVEVDENLRGSEDRSAFGGFGGTTDGSTSESRTDFERTDKDRF